MDVQQLINADKACLQAVNGSDSLFWDGTMWILSDTKTWLLLAAMLLYIIFKNNQWKSALVILLMLALTVTLADQFSSGLCKPYFLRFRPSQDPEFMWSVNIVNNYRGGSYGFISSHAANCFAVAVFMALLLRNWGFTVMVFLWALLPTYSRAYLGVHYPGDLLCGALAGSAIAGLVYLLYLQIRNRYLGNTQHISSQYTSTGYEVQDIHMFFTALLVTLFYVLIKALWLSQALNF